MVRRINKKTEYWPLANVNMYSRDGHYSDFFLSLTISLRILIMVSWVTTMNKWLITQVRLPTAY